MWTSQNFLLVAYSPQQLNIEAQNQRLIIVVISPFRQEKRIDQPQASGQTSCLN